MKYIFFLLVTLFFAKKTFAQCNVDSIISFSENVSGNWILGNKMLYKYTNNQKVKSILNLTYSSATNTLDTFYKEVYEYDNKDRIKTYTYYDFDGNNLYLYAKNEYFLNTIGNDSLILNYLYDLNTSTFKLNERYLRTYNGSNQLIQSLDQNYNSNSQTWINKLRATNNYNGIFLNYTIQESWDIINNNWKLSDKFIKIYNNGNRTSDTFLTWQSGKLIKKNHSTYYLNQFKKDTLVKRYDLNGNLITTTGFEYNINRCVLKSKFYTGINKTFKSYELYYYNPNSISINTQNLKTLSIFPNPTNSSISILNAKNLNFEIIELSSGKSLISGKIDSDKEILNLEEFNNGVYVLKLNNQYLKIIKN